MILPDVGASVWSDGPWAVLVSAHQAFTGERLVRVNRRHVVPAYTPIASHSSYHTLNTMRSSCSNRP